ncbi:MAG: hypothetical protein ABSB74_20975 [Tepidisphaeraceae bacterium]
MRRHPKQRSVSRRRQTSRHGLILVESMESRVLLSDAGLAPIWATQEAPPVNSPVNSQVESIGNPVSTYDPVNGDLLVAYGAVSTTAPPLGYAPDRPIIVAAYKPNGTGGLVLDTSFGGYNNDGWSNIGGTNPDGSPAAVPGFSIVNVQALISGQPQTEPTFPDMPLAIAVDKTSGRIDILMGQIIPGITTCTNLLQLLPNGTPDPSFGNWDLMGNPVGGNGAELIDVYTWVAAHNPAGKTPLWACGDALTLANNDIIVAGSTWMSQDAPPGTLGANIFAFSASTGNFDPSFGGSGWIGVSYPNPNPSNPPLFYGFTAITSDSSGNLYAAGNSYDNPLSLLATGVDVVKIDSSGNVLWSSEISSIPNENAGTLSNAFGIGLANIEANVIVGGAATGGYFLSTLSASTGALSTADVGQQFVSCQFLQYQYPSQMQVNPDGEVIVNSSSLFVPGATWFSGSSNEQLFDPYNPAGEYGYSLGCAVFYNVPGGQYGLGSVVLVNAATTLATDPNPGIGEITLAAYNSTSQVVPVQPAAANPNPVTGTTTSLSALGWENGGDGEANLSYSWSANGPAAVTYTGSTIGTDGVDHITANFRKAGNYNFTVTITAPDGLYTTSSVAVNVQQTISSGITVTSSPPVGVDPGGTKQFFATAMDQFNNPITTGFAWSITGSGNSIDQNGLATFGLTPGTYTVTATMGSVNGTASVIDGWTPIVSAFQVNDGSAQRAMVDSLTVTFNEPVTLSASAITLYLLSQTGGPSMQMGFTLTPGSGSNTTWVLTFTGSSYLGGSLWDGAYELIVSAGGVTSAQGLNMSANQDFTFWRFYGDFEGLGTVNGGDFTLLVTLLGKQTNSSDWYVDYYDTGSVTGGDFTELVTRLGTSISIPSLPSVELLAAAPPVITSTSTTMRSTTTSTTKQTRGSSAVPSVAAAPKHASKQKPRHVHA